MIILFEDNPTSPVSECLSASCVGELRESLRKQGRSSISISLEEFHQLQRLLYDKMSSDLGLKMKPKI